MKKSILDKAKATKKRKEVTEQDIEVSIAFIKGEITLTQMAKAYGKDRITEAGCYSKVTRSIREAYSQGKITIE